MELNWGKIIRFMTVRFTEGIVVLLLIMFMPNIPPYCKISDPIPVTPSKPLEGKLALNERLNDVVIWHKGDLYGPEAFTDYNGELYCSLHTGEVAKLVNGDVKTVVTLGKPCKGFHEEKICGRPLGLKFDKDGSLIVADAYYGIFRVDVKTGEKVQLVSLEDEINGKKPKLPNSVAIASNGDIYWSDSSTEFHLEDGVFDLFADGSGRLIHYNVKTKVNTVLIDNLLFANGVALSEDEEFVIVAETGRSCVHRYYLKGPKKGTKDIFIDGLPGLPDNINHDGKGGFFLPLIVARDDYTPIPNQVLGGFPLFRKLIARIIGLTELGFSIANQVYQHELFERGIHLVGHFSVTSFFLPRRVTIVHLSKTGEIIGSLHGNNRKTGGISEAYVFNGDLYLGSPFNDYIARISLNKVGLEHLEKRSQPEQKAKDIPTTQQPSTTVTTPSPKTITTSAPTQAPTPKVTTTSAPNKAPTITTPAPANSQPTTKLPSQKKETLDQKPSKTPKVTPTTPKPAEAPKPTPKTESTKSAQPTPSQTNKQEPKSAQPNKQEPKPTQPNKGSQQESKPTQTSKQESKPPVSQSKAPPQQKQTPTSQNKVPK